MNGAPYYSPPHRHQKSYTSRLGSLAEDVLKPELAELPGLVAAAIRKGLIKRPAPSETIPTPVTKVGPLADWQTIACTECGCTFERRQRKSVKCQSCRAPIRNCQNCGVEFRSRHLNRVGCSAACSKAMGIIRLKATRNSKNIPKMAECIVCHQVKPVRPSGSGVAKACSPECSKKYRAIRNAERKTK
jgi:hypothetical protein